MKNSSIVTVAAALVTALAALFNLPLLAAFLSGITFVLLILHGAKISSFLQPNSANILKKELEESNEQLRTVEARYGVIVDNITALVLIRDLHGKVIFASPYSVVLSGYQAAELSSEIIESAIPDTHREIFARANKIAALGEPFTCQHPLKHKSGVTLWVDSRIAPIEDTKGTVQGTLTVMIDATATVRYQHQVEAYASELRDVSSMISHDLKSPIATIRGMTLVISQEKERLTSEGREALEHIEHATNSMEELVKEILTYFKSVSDEILQEEVDLYEVLRSVKADLKGLLDSVQGDIQIGDASELLKSDRVKLYQIIANLVSNGIKYRDLSRAPRVDITITASPHAVVLKVLDNGQGIPSDKLTHIFRPYVRLGGSAADGHGLGLATVKKLVERLKATIEVTSTVGQGSTFTVTFPR